MRQLVPAGETDRLPLERLSAATLSFPGMCTAKMNMLNTFLKAVDKAVGVWGAICKNTPIIMIFNKILIFNNYQFDSQAYNICLTEDVYLNDMLFK